jgi:hypothetical protein
MRECRPTLIMGLPVVHPGPESSSPLIRKLFIVSHWQRLYLMLFV